MIKDQIADAFQRYFHQFGFKKTSVDEVAGELKISKKTIYQHFTSKEAILQYIIQRNAQAILAEMSAAVPQEAGEAARLEQLIRLIHRVARDFNQQKVSFALQFRQEIAETAYHQAFSQIIAELIRTGVEKGTFHSADLEMTIHFVNLLVTESIRWMAKHPQKPVEDETVRMVMSLLR